MRRLAVTAIAILSTLPMFGCSDFGDEESTEEGVQQDITASTTSFPQDRLDRCKKNKISPCTYTSAETRALLSPGGAAYEQLRTTAADHNLLTNGIKLEVVFSNSDEDRPDIVYFRVTSPWAGLPTGTPVVIVDIKAGKGAEVRDFWYLIAQVMVEMVRGPVHYKTNQVLLYQGCGPGAPHFEAERVHLDQNPTYSDPNLNAECRYIFTQATRLTVGLLRGETNAAALTFGGVASAFDELRAGSVTTGRRLQVGEFAAIVVVGVISLYTQHTALNHASASQPSRDFVTKAATLSDVAQDSTCGATSLAELQGCPQPRPLGCVTYSTAGGLNETAVDCDDSRRALCFHDKTYDVTSKATEERYADGACKAEFGIASTPYLGEALTSTEKGNLKTKYPNFTVATGLVACLDDRGTKQGCDAAITVLANTGKQFTVTASGKRQKTEVGAGRQSARGANDAYGQLSFPRNRLDDEIEAAKKKLGTAGRYRAQALIVHTVNIGSGSCHLLQCLTLQPAQTYQLENIVVDCGSSNTGFSGMGVGGVEAYFQRTFVTAQPPAGLQVSRPIVYVSHPDADHYNYLEGVFANAPNAFQPKKIFLGGNPRTYIGRVGDLAGFAGFLANANANVPGGINVNGGGTLTAQTAVLTQNTPLAEFQCAGVTLRTLTVNEPPPQALRNNQAAVRNGNSLVLGLKWDDGRFAGLFPGDALGFTETAALRSPWFNGIPNTFQRFLAASHHGSDANGSSSQALINAFDPTLVQYSAGQQYGHPSSAVARRLENTLAPSTNATHGLIASDGDYHIYATNRDQFGTAYGGSRIQFALVVYRNDQVVARTSGALSSGTTVKANFDRGSRPSAAWTSGNLGEVCTLTRTPAGVLECN
jgi:hypothetical protein